MNLFKEGDRVMHTKTSLNGKVAYANAYEFTVNYEDGEKWAYPQGINYIKNLSSLSAHQPVEKTLSDYIKAINLKVPEDKPAVSVPKHKHYFKNISHLKEIDIYRVLDLFEVTHPCLQHAAKKILVAGNRGHKDIQKDIQEAIDSLGRWQEMQMEDNKKETQ